MHTGRPVRSAAATLETTRAQMQEMIKKAGGVDLFSLDAQHRPNSDERELVRRGTERRGVGNGERDRLIDVRRRERALEAARQLAVDFHDRHEHVALVEATLQQTSGASKAT